MAEKYPSQSLPDKTTASEDQSKPTQDQKRIVVDKYGPMVDHCGVAVDQSEPTGGQHGQVADQTNPDPVQRLITDQASALQFAQKTGAATVNFTETQYNISGGQTINNIYYPGQTQPSTLDMSKESATSVTFDLNKCQEELREYYLEEMGKVNMLPWIPEENKEMETIFVDLELIRREETKTSEGLASNEDLVTLKTRLGPRVNRVLLTGDAGSGKSTTASNLAYKWALNDTQSPLSKFTLVFLIRMKHIEDSNSSLVDMIFQNILSDDSNVSKNSLSIYIRENAKDILFILDGMDEDRSGALKNKSSEITKLLYNRQLRKSCVILTTRSRNVGDLGMYASHYTQVTLEGFSVKNINKYIVKFFRDDPDKVDLLFRKLKAEPHILALASVPVVLLMICMLWEDQRTTPKTKTQLYQKTVRYLWRRYKAKKGKDQALDDDSVNEELDGELTDLLHKLGEVALNNTHSHPDWNKYIFTVHEFGRDVCDLGCQVGIQKREQSRVGIERKTSVAFLHATFKYFCAAFYLAHLLDTKQKQLDEFDGKLFSSWNGYGFMYNRCVLEFCCGIQPEIANTFLQYQTQRTIKTSRHQGINTFNVNISNHIRHVFEGQLSYEQCSNLIPLFSGHNTSIYLTDDLIPSILYLLEQYKSPTTQTGCLSTIKSLEVKTGCNPWLLTLLKHTYNLSDCEIFLGVSGTKRDLNMMYKALSELPNIKKLVLNAIGIHAPLFHRSDATNLLNFLIEKKVKLTEFHLLGFMFDEKSMVRYLSITRTSIMSLGLHGTLDARGNCATMNVIENLPRLHLKHLNHLEFSLFQVNGAIKHLRPIISQLALLTFQNCRLCERHLKELFCFLSRAQKLKYLNLSQNVLSVEAVQALVESLETIPALEKLMLDDTGLNDTSACILARFVRGKRSINRLCLYPNPGIGHAVKDVLRGLPLQHYVSSGMYDGEYKDIDIL